MPGLTVLRRKEEMVSVGRHRFIRSASVIIEIREIRERISAMEGKDRDIEYMQVLDALKSDRE